MANHGVEFIVIDEFEDKPRVVDNISLKIEPKRTSQNLDYKVLIPLQINYSKKESETLLKVSACATGDSFSATYRSFRGQFISPVFDEKSAEEHFSIPHLIDQKGSTKKTYVERCSWEEGKSPQIQLITNRKEGVIDLHFLAILGAEEDFPQLDTRIGIEICVEELISKSGRTRELGKFIIDLDENAVDDFPYDEEMMIRTFEEHSHQVKGNGSCIHPKQLITVELLKSMLDKETIEYFGGKIDLGYIGLDTGENILSVLRYLDREELTNMISSLNIFYEEEWDELYRKRLGSTIANCGINVNWVEINSSGIENYKVDFMISTYVAVWAANEEKIQTAEHEEYFKNSYEWCKDKAFLISVDPLDPGKIARSHRYTAAIDVTSYYKKAGFEEIKEVLFQGVNRSCKDSIWKKGDINYKTHFDDTLQHQKLDESEEQGAESDEYTVNETTKFIQDFAGEIECAGIPANAAKLVLADVLKDKSTEFVVQGGWASDSKTFGIIMPKRDNLRCSININKFDSANKQREDGKLIFNSYMCGDERLEFDIDFEFWEDDPDKQGIDIFIQSIAEMFETGLLEAPLAVYSPFPVLVTGLPGEGKSVRMKQIVAEISSNDEIIEVPIFLKAKHLAKYVEKQETADYMSESSDFRTYAEIIAKSFLDSNPLAGKLDEKLVLENLLEINSNISDDDDCGLVLVVDAIDEIVELESIRLLLQWLDDFSDRYGAGHSRCVISTRPSHEEYVAEIFPSANKFNMYFEKSTLQSQFPQKLVDEWRVNDIVSEKVTKLIQKVEVFGHINKPLLIGWLCRFVKDGTEVFEEGEEEDRTLSSYKFYEKILDQAVTTKRFTTQSDFSELEIDSIKRMRDCIAFVDLLALVKESIGTIELTNKANRLRLLAIRHSGFFPGLEKLSDEEAHRLFFEDMSLIFVSGSGQIAWTHDHLREFSASLLLCLEPIRRNDLFDVLSHEKYELFNTDVDFYSTVENEVLPHKKYFREAIQNNPKFSSLARLEAVPSEVWNVVSSSFNTASGKLQFIADKIVHGQEVHPSEYAELLENESFVDDIDVNDVNKENFIIFSEYFFQQDINWLFGLGSDSKTKFVKTYLELITGGVISKLAEKLLSEEERAELFKKKNMNSIFHDSDKFSYTKMKAMIFENFIKSSDNYDIKNYTKIWNQNFQPKDIILDKNNLNLDTKSFNKLLGFFNRSEVENNTSKYIFNKINNAASPDFNTPEELVLRKKLEFARAENNEDDEYEVIQELMKILVDEERFDEGISLCDEILGRQGIMNFEMTSHAIIMKGWYINASGNVKESMTIFEEGLKFANQNNILEDEAVVSSYLAEAYLKMDNFDKAKKHGENGLKISKEIGDEEKVGGIYFTLGRIEKEIGNYDLAKEYYHESLDRAKKFDKKYSIYSTLYRIGLMEIEQGNYDEAERYYQESLIVRKEANDKQAESLMLYRLGKLAITQGNFEIAEERFSESLEIDIEIGNKDGQSVMLSHLGELAQKIGDLTKAEEMFRRSLEIAKENGDDKFQSVLLSRLGKISVKNQDFAIAESLYNEALTIDKRIGDREHESITLHRLGMLQRKLGNYDSAKAFYLQSLEIDREIGDRKGESSMLSRLGNLEREAGNFDAAKKLYSESLLIDREIGDREGESNVLSRLGNLEREAGNFDAAKKLYSESLLIDREIGNKSHVAWTVLQLAELAKDEGDFSLASELYEQQIDLRKQLGDEHKLSIAMIRFAEFLVHLKKYDDALKLIDNSINIIKNSEMANTNRGKRNISIDLELRGYINSLIGNSYLAKESYNQAMKLAVEIEDYMIISSLYHKLGELESYLGNYSEATKLLKKSKDIFNEHNLANEDGSNSQYVRKAKRRLQEDFKMEVYDSEQDVWYDWDDLEDDPKSPDGISDLGVIIDSYKTDWNKIEMDVARLQGWKLSKDRSSDFKGWVLAGDVESSLEPVSDSMDIKTKASNSNVSNIINRNVPLYFDILGMNFFFDERHLSKLLRIYWMKSSDIPQPVNAVIMNNITTQRKKGEDAHPLFEIEYHVLDGKNNLMILFAAIIEAYRRLDNLESMPDNFHKIRYQDNTDEGSIVDLLTKHEDYGDDVSSFVENINTILDSVQNQGKLEDFIQSVSEGRIRVSLVKTDKKSHCKDCGHAEFETGEDGERYCKSCGALDEDSLYDFGSE